MGLSYAVGGLKPGVCTSSSRPGSPYEGQMIYETDTDLLRIWNGSAWRTLAFSTPTNGSIIQVVASTSSSLALNSTTTYADTGLSASITPASSSNKILCIVNHPSSGKTVGNASSHIFARLLRGSTEISLFEASAGFTNSSVDNYIGTISTTYLDSPSTTSSVTYKTQIKNSVAAGSVFTSSNSATATMTLMEIVA